MDARDLSKLAPDVKSHTMKALASLSKFLGRYDDWLDMVKRHQLKWSSAANNSMKAFQSIFDCDDQGKSIGSMMKWIRDVMVVLPQPYKNLILFNTLTGLRPNEAQKAIFLVKNNENQYVGKERMLLKHYQFPNLFIRQTKNAYISIIDRDFGNSQRYSKSNPPNTACYATAIGGIGTEGLCQSNGGQSIFES